jgi:hypothetical protein
MTNRRYSEALRTFALRFFPFTGGLDIRAFEFRLDLPGMILRERPQKPRFHKQPYTETSLEDRLPDLEALFDFEDLATTSLFHPVWAQTFTSSRHRNEWPVTDRLRTWYGLEYEARLSLPNPSIHLCAWGQARSPSWTQTLMLHVMHEMLSAATRETVYL